MPPADQVEEFAKDYEQGQIKPRNKGVPAQQPIRGHRWELVPENLEKLYNMPNFPLKSYKDIKLYDPEAHASLTGEYIDSPEDFWNNVAPGGEYKGKNIYLNPFLEPDRANHALWHELQHGYQYQEGRDDKNYKAPKRWDQEGYDESYYDHPMELDADQFADFMQKYPLIRPAEPHYDSKWVTDDAHLDGEWNPDTEEYELTPDQLRDYIERIKPHYSHWKEANWEDNIWYHVTRKENLQQIRDHGLAPRASMGQSKNFNLPVGDKVVYLHPNVAGAAAYASQNSALLFHTETDSQDWIVLRVRNLDKRRLLPDHEAFLQQAQDAEGYNDIDHHFFNYQEWDAQQEGGEWNGGSYGNSLEYLMQLPAGARLALIKDWSESHPNEAVMYIGTIPAQNIDIVGPLYENEHGIDRTHQDIHDQYYDYNDYLENMGYDNQMGGLEDDGDDFKNLFKYQPMFSKWQLAKV